MTEAEPLLSPHAPLGIRASALTDGEAADAGLQLVELPTVRNTRAIRIVAIAAVCSAPFAVLLAWRWSYRCDAALFWSSGGHRCEIYSQQGSLGVVWFTSWPLPQRLTYRIDVADVRPPPRSWGPLGVGWMPRTNRSLLGFQWAAGTYWPPFSWQMPRVPFYRAAVPYWFLFCLASAGPVLLIPVLRSRGRRRDLDR